jgi:hypothetical protein
LYQGAVSCVDQSSGRTLWEQKVGGFPFAVAAADIDGDGKAVAFAGCADGVLYAFSPTGQPLWKFAPNTAAKYSVVVCNQGRGRRPILACGGMDRIVHLLSTSGKRIASYDFRNAITQMAVGDLDREGLDEIVVTSTRAGRYEILQIKGDKLESLQHHRFDRVKQVFESAGEERNFNAYSIEFCDLDSDGRCEIIAGGEYKAGLPIRAVSSTGETLWTTPQLTGPDTRGFQMLDYYTMPLVRCGDVSSRSQFCGGEALHPHALISSHVDFKRFDSRCQCRRTHSE